MKKRLSVLAGALAAVVVCCACAVHVAAPHEATSSVLNIYCWNNEFKTRMEQYYKPYDKSTHTIGDVKVNWVIVPNEQNAYQNALDAALAYQDTDSASDKVDLFLVEADNVLKYTGTSNYAMDIAELGITETDLSEQFAYTRSVVTDKQGKQRGISWQACPGLMIYRRDIAKQVFGTDDPDKIQALTDNWTLFDSCAEQLADNDFRILAGYDDTYRVFAASRSQAWVNSAQEIVVDPALKQWISQSKRYLRAGYSHSYKLWSSAWASCARKRTFCYFGPAWFIDYTLMPSSLSTRMQDGGIAQKGNGTYGQWAACRGPGSYFWGGSWLCAANGSDNTDLIADIMRVMCCNADTATRMAQDVNEFANNKTAMKQLAQDPSFGSDFLGGQNIYGVLYDSANAVYAGKLTAYDQGLTESLQLSYHDYFIGKTDEHTAYINFLRAAHAKYPELNTLPSSDTKE